MDRQAVPARIDDKNSSRKHRPVHRLSDMQVSPRDQVNSTFADTVYSECSDKVQSAMPLLSPPYHGPSLVTVQLFKGVFFKAEDFETAFASPSQPQQVTQDQQLSPPVKKPRMDTTRADSAQPRAVRQSQRQPAEDKHQKELNKQDGHVITLALQCAEWNCSQMFTTNQHNTAVDQLNHHLKADHSIGPFRCVVLYCAESFPNRQLIGQHIKHFHAGIKEWHCSKCAKHYASYRLLFQHKIGQHQQGIFKCSFPECNFTGEHKSNVFSHYAIKHTDKPELECYQAKSGCVYRTTNPSLRKDHERVHLGLKPFRCEWPNCGHSCASRSNTIDHIKQIHLSTKTSSIDVVALYGKPADYLSVDRSLLQKHRLLMSHSSSII